MQNKTELIIYNGKIHRVLIRGDERSLLINCMTRTMPFYINTSDISDCPVCEEKELLLKTKIKITDIDSLSAESKKTAHQRYTMISPVLFFVNNEGMRSYMIDEVSKEYSVSKQTVRKYLCLYLAYQNISVLSSYKENPDKLLSDDEKNFRWALNKYFYSQRKNTLKDTYTLMLKERYTDNTGKLTDNYPPFHRFRYYYQKNKKLQKYYISRNGMSEYQRNHRPMIKNGIREYATGIGTGLIDSTICDIYLVNEEGQLIGRPILTACVDAYSSLCLGYSLSWEGGVYSLKLLMENIISDKVEHCKSFGILIDKTAWNCSYLSSTFLTDKGKEYTAYILEQLTELGVRIINLPPYRPDLKGTVEKFFDVIQKLYKPHLKGRGVIEADFQERGATDYRKQACLTLREFETILINCIIYYNTKRIIKDFAFTEEMLSSDIKPYANEIWNYALCKTEANVIFVSPELLKLTLLPRTEGVFSRKGLTVNKMRYYAEGFTERYLQGDTCLVAYNPDNISSVWLVENGTYIPFALIDRQYSDYTVEDMISQKAKQGKIIKNAERESLQAKVKLIREIEAISSSCHTDTQADITSIRATRSKEKKRCHKGEFE